MTMFDQVYFSMLKNSILQFLMLMCFLRTILKTTSLVDVINKYKSFQIEMNNIESFPL